MAHAQIPHPFRKRSAGPVAIMAPSLSVSPWRALPWLLAALFLLAAATGLHAQVAINSTGAAPNPGGSHSILDISSADKGILAPRMTSAQRVNLTGTAVNGLLIYQTDSVALSPRGYWYWDAFTPVVGWKHIAWGGDIWKLGGNTGTTNVNFLGTLNNMPLVFRTNNQERGRLSANGELQLYYSGSPVPVPLPSPNELVEVEGGIKLTGGSNVDNEGTIKFTPAVGKVPGKFEGYVVNAGGTAVNGWKQIDNNFGERKIQDSPIAGTGCQDPTTVTFTAAAVTAVPRPWPIPGPAGPFATLNGVQSPYWGLWEDSHRQWLFRQADIAVTGICPGPANPIRAIAFNVAAVGGGGMRLHFMRFSLKNTAAVTAANFDMALLTTYAMPSPPNIVGPPPSYTMPAHNTGYTVNVGWNVHPYDQGGPGFFWAGSNLLVDASVDNQDWGGMREGSVFGYNSGYQSMVSVYCDACGGTGGHFACLWTAPLAGPVFWFPPTTPANGLVGPNSNIEGWGWTGGWNLTGGTLPELCDGGTETWNPVGSFNQSNLLPRVAFLCEYTGGGAAYNVGNYMVAQTGVMIGDAVWAASGAYPANRFRGPGTISAQKSVWSGNSLLSDYVFDLYYDGNAKPEDAKGAGQYVRTPLKDLPNYVERERHLPTVDGRDTWNKTGTFSVDKLGNQLWVTVEDQSLYIQELNARMDALQKFLVVKKLKELEQK
ncbi:MAG: hypothetical protein IPL81_14830 [Flavobacteriales bacterium]|nr:hypothetical protein [Flavobacteriales bacterium]